MGIHRRIFLFSLLGFLLYTSGTFAENAREYKEGELLIKFRSGINSQTATVSHASLGSQVAKRYRKTGIQLVKLRHGLTAEEATGIYKRDPSVEYAEPNYRRRALEVFPNDPMFDDLWGIHNTGQTGGTPDADLDAPEAWEMTTGSNELIVAIIDTGVDYNHEDLSANMWVNATELYGTPGADDDGNGYIDDVYGIDPCNGDTDPMDDDGHGTLCSGIIGAAGDNGVGIVGLNWNVNIMALKFLDDQGNGWDTNAIECLEYAVMMKENYGHNIRITNNSWGGGGYSQALHDAIQAAGDAGILFVTAAGNSSLNNNQYPVFPSSYDAQSIIAVTATDHHDDLASFSNWGSNTVDVAAPGVDVYSTLIPFSHLSGTCHDDDGNGYGYCSGTSMAAPYVSGLAALVLTQHPAYSWDQVKWNILTTVDPLSTLEGRILSGGRINANNALTCNPALLHVFVRNPSSGFGFFENNQSVIRASVGTCEGPVGQATLTVDFDNGESSLTLYDDGVYPDVVESDGLYSGFWAPSVLGDVTLTFTASGAGYEPGFEQVSGTVAYWAGQWAMGFGGSHGSRTESVQQIPDGGFVVLGRDFWVLQLNANGTTDWQKTYGGSDSDWAYSIQQTSDGGYMVAGWTKSFEAVDADFWVVRLNPDGTVVWQKTYGGSDSDWAYAMKVTSDGGCIVAGYTESFGVVFGDIWVVKLNADGSIAWQKTYGGIGNDWGYSVDQTSDGGYIVAGHGYSFSGRGAIWMLKLHADGSIAWQKVYNTSNGGRPYCVQQTPDGGYVVAGHTASLSSDSYDVWLLKLNSDGTIAWQKTYGGNKHDYAFSVQHTADGGYVVAGWTKSFGAGKGDAWILKLNADGTLVWQKTYGGIDFDSASSIQQTSDGGYIVAGQTNSFGAAATDTWMLRLDADGEIPNCSAMRDSHAVVSETWADVEDTAVVPVDSFAVPVDTNATPYNTMVEPSVMCPSDAQPVPFVAKIRPRPCPPGDNMRIIGAYFGETQGDSVVHIGPTTYDATSPRIKEWSDTKIRIKIPFTNKPCDWFKHGEGDWQHRKRKVWVTVGGVDSNTKMMRVFKPDTCP